MAQVSLTVGDRDHVVSCRDGGEDRLRTIAAMLDSRWEQAKRAAGNAGNERAMLLIALMLADELDEARSQPAAAAGPDDSALARLAERLERLADTLEEPSASA